MTIEPSHLWRRVCLPCAANAPAIGGTPPVQFWDFDRAVSVIFFLRRGASFGRKSLALMVLGQKPVADCWLGRILAFGRVVRICGTVIVAATGGAA